MNATQPVTGLLRIPAWPRVTAVVGTDGTGTITVNDIERACAAESMPALRAGMIARSVAVAVRLGRPVRLDVTDNGQTHTLAVRPEGYVQLVDAAGTITPADGLTVAEARCRICRRLQPVTFATCVQCGVNDPLRVETTPTGPDVYTGVPTASEGPLTAERADTGGSTDVLEADVEVPHDLHDDASVDQPPIRVRSTFRDVSSASTVRLTLSTQDPVVVEAGITVGRDPDSIGGRTAVPLVSPGRLLSRSHATIDVDDHGQLVITDLYSSNGIELLTDPPRLLPAGQPTVVPDGITVQLGDVCCTITAHGVSSRFL